MSWRGPIRIQSRHNPKRKKPQTNTKPNTKHTQNAKKQQNQKHTREKLIGWPVQQRQIDGEESTKRGTSPTSAMRKPGLPPARSKPYRPAVLCRFTLDPLSHHVSLFDFYFPDATWQRHCWLLDRIHESVRMLPVRLAPKKHSEESDRRSSSVNSLNQ